VLKIRLFPLLASAGRGTKGVGTWDSERGGLGGKYVMKIKQRGGTKIQ